VKCDPESRRRPGESREPFYTLHPDFHREHWIPAFAGMTANAMKANNEWFLVLIVTDCGQGGGFLAEQY
jgi:hypothetical protein